MPPHEFREMQEETRGAWGSRHSHWRRRWQVVIVEPMDGTPASRLVSSRVIGL
jgi:C-terminal processing protease CtpA/Prc